MQFDAVQPVPSAFMDRIMDRGELAHFSLQISAASRFVLVRHVRSDSTQMSYGSGGRNPPRPTSLIRLICFATAPYGNVEPRRVVTSSTTGLCARTLKLLSGSEG